MNPCTKQRHRGKNNHTYSLFNTARSIFVIVGVFHISTFIFIVGFFHVNTLACSSAAARKSRLAMEEMCALVFGEDISQTSFFSRPRTDVYLTLL